MRKTILVAIMLAGCSLVRADDPQIVTLNAKERSQAQALAVRRDNVQMKRNAASAAFQAQMNRLSEEEAQINNEEAQLCIELKRSHQLQGQTQYRIEEWRGELVRQH